MKIVSITLLASLAFSMPAYSQSSDPIYLAAMRSCDEYENTKKDKSYRYEKGVVVLVSLPNIKDDAIRFLAQSRMLVIDEIHNLDSIKLTYIKVKRGTEHKWIKKLKKEEIVTCCYLSVYVRHSLRDPEEIPFPDPESP